MWWYLEVGPLGGTALLSGFSSLRKDPRERPLPSSHVRTQREDGHLWTGGGRSPASALTLDLPACLLFKPPSLGSFVVAARTDWDGMYSLGPFKKLYLCVHEKKCVQNIYECLNIERNTPDLDFSFWGHLSFALYSFIKFNFFFFFFNYFLLSE